MAGLENDLLSFVKDFLSTVGYPGVFVLMAIEGFGIPIPSELTMPFSGFLASTAGGNKFILPAAVLAGAAGEVTGGVIAYYLGYLGGRPVFERYGRIVLISSADLDKAERWFARYGNWVVFVMRLLPAVRSFIALPAGVVRMPFSRFLAFSAAGSLIWCTALTLIGHTLGQNWNSVSGNLRKYDVLIVILLVLLIAFIAYKRLSAVRRVEHDEPSVTDRKVSP